MTHDPDLELAIPLPILDSRWARTPDEYLLADYGEAGRAPTSPPAVDQDPPIFEPMPRSARALLWLWIATVLGLCAFWGAVVVLVT